MPAIGVQESDSTMQAPKVLIVDDEAGIRFSLESFLSDAGLEVFSAPDVDEAFELSRQHVFDAAIIDLMLPAGRTGGLCRECPRGRGVAGHPRRSLPGSRRPSLGVSAAVGPAQCLPHRQSRAGGRVGAQ